jgi:phosphatidylserine decarboxylase
MHLTGYGRREWSVITVIAVAIGAVLGLLVSWWWVIAAAALWVALVSFFRDPWRRVPRDLPEGTMLSPADGTVSAVFEVDTHVATGGPATVVRIFLSVLNVHVNRAPCAGTVTAIEHTPGKYLNALKEESARENESNLVTLEIAGGERVGVRQVSGAIARRIVCAIAIGDRVARGERFGMIKFGSTAELILPRPADVTVHVAKGDRVRGGLTKLATLVPRANSS